jgi:hypothetical protein
MMLKYAGMRQSKRAAKAGTRRLMLVRIVKALSCAMPPADPILPKTLWHDMILQYSTVQYSTVVMSCHYIYTHR